MIQLRVEVLLSPIGIQSNYIDSKEEEKDILIGAFEEENILGCCILTHIDQESVRLRQMAVKESIQHVGIGSKILNFAENIAKKNGYEYLKMHARYSAISFYEKKGYKIVGHEFTEVGIQHRQMEKKLII